VTGAKRREENAQPAYAESFGVASAHLSRRSEREGGTSNTPTPKSEGLIWKPRIQERMNQERMNQGTGFPR